MGEHWPRLEAGSIADEGVIDTIADDGATDGDRPISTAASGAYELDAQSRFVAVDDGLVELTGYERETLLGQHVSLVVGDEYADSVETLVRTLLPADAQPDAVDTGTGTATVLPAETTVTLELPLSSDDETTCRTHRLRRLERSAQADRIAGAVEPKAGPSGTRERELEAANERLRAIFDAADDAIIVGDDERIAAANSAASDLLGIDGSDLHGRSLKEFVHDDHDISSTWETFIEEGRLRGTVSLVPPDGPERIVEYNAVANVVPGTHLSIFRDVTDRHRRERQLERQQERLAALEGINDVAREITAAVVEESTRRELERVTCESLVDFPACKFAFVAEVDATTGEIRNRVEAGVDGYVDAIPLSTDPDDPAGRGPLGRAIRTQSMQLSTDVFADPDFEPWRDDAREYGYRAAAAVPITHEGTLYGVLGLTSASSTAFEGDTRDIVSQLGEILGHAIAARDRKRALVSDDLIELDYEIRNAFELFDVPATDERICFDRVVQIGDDRFLEYGTTTTAAFPAFERLVEQVPHWDEVAILDESDDVVTFELEITSPPMFSVVAGYGGYVEQAVLEDGDYTMTVHLPKRTDVRALTAAIQDVYPVAENVARRQVTAATESIDRVQNHLSRVLTDRQRTVLETAYYAGFFEWPRTSTGEEIADRLDISPATFHEHFRTAQRKLVAAVVDRPGSIPQDGADE